MKTRFRGNSIRFRLTQTEVNALAAGELVSDEVELTSDTKLRFELQPSAHAPSLEPLTNGFRLQVPADLAQAWADSTQETLSLEIPVSNGNATRVSVEKDFACLRPRDAAEDVDTFPHPNAEKGC